MIFRYIPPNDLQLVTLPNGKTDLALVRGVEYVRQSIWNGFNFWLGEWFLDASEGVPYRRDVLVKDPDLVVVRTLFVRMIRQTAGVVTLTGFRLLFDRANRTLGVVFSCTCDDGNALTVDSRLDARWVFSLDKAA
jgi:hypothetical protein